MDMLIIFTQLQKNPISHFSGEILENRIKKWIYMYTIVLNNQFCINTLNRLKVLLKSVQAIRQCLDKGLFSKM